VVAVLLFAGAIAAGLLAAVRVSGVSAPVVRDSAGERRRSQALGRELDRRSRSLRRSGLLVLLVAVVLGAVLRPGVTRADSISYTQTENWGGSGDGLNGWISTGWCCWSGSGGVATAPTSPGYATLWTGSSQYAMGGTKQIQVLSFGAGSNLMLLGGLAMSGNNPSAGYGVGLVGGVWKFGSYSQYAAGGSGMVGTVSANVGDKLEVEQNSCVFTGFVNEVRLDSVSDCGVAGSVSPGIVGYQVSIGPFETGPALLDYFVALDATQTAEAGATATAGVAPTQTAEAEASATAGAGATATAGAIATMTAAPVATALALGCSIASDGNYVCLPGASAQATATAVAMIPTPNPDVPDPELADCLAFAVDLQTCQPANVPAGEVGSLPTVTPTPVPGGAVLLQCWDGSVQYTCPAEPTVISAATSTPGPAEVTATAEATVGPTATPVPSTPTPDAFAASAAATATAQQAAVLSALATQRAGDSATATVEAVKTAVAERANAVGTANAVSYVAQLQAYETAQAAGAQATATAAALAQQTAQAGQTATAQAVATATAQAQATQTAGGVLPTATAVGTAAPGGGEPTATPVPWSTPTGPVALATSDAGKRCSLAAEAAVGVIGQGSIPYCWGGSNPTSTYSVESLCPEGHGMDCSGMVIWAYQQAGANIPRYTAQGIHDNVPANGCSLADMGMRSCWETGDVLFLAHNGDANDIYHVSMYVGNGLVADCYNTAVGCTVWSPLDKASYQEDFVAGGRPSEVWGGGACGDEQTGQQPGGGRPGGVATPGMGWPQVNVPAQLKALFVPDPQ
jgi:cell wall-associated NlpC family hydrolase